MKCLVCGLRKGKRVCPAKSGLICAQCCGQKRVIEIACPSDCPHLTTGQSYHQIKQYVSLLLREENPARSRSFYETLNEWGHVIGEMERAIVSYSAGVRSLRDGDVAQAVEAVRKTRESEERGFFFEHSSSNPLAESLARELRARIEELGEQPPDSDLPAPRNRDVIRCLQVVEAKIGYFQTEGEGPRDYLAFISRSYPEQAVRSGGGGLIIP